MRLVASLIALAASAAAMSGPTFSAFTGEVEAPSELGTGQFEPVALTAPVISGTVQSLGSLSVQTQGTWNAKVPITRSYEWQACTSAAATSCVTLPGTGVNLTLPFVLPNPFIRVIETATTTNFGSGSEPSVPIS